ncbi:hypothetical protein B1H19_31645 [Streptomyces gilvosporeus]|uniref:DUF6777 domain-containing protein n=1 Tax=Streptomyces gilvosporeus TaxID=553510 RepID=A0A1V0TZB5_9ACTN|nr:hypothetical protein B1H19_31645 [Streptomyces gilvosporeus]
MLQPAAADGRDPFTRSTAAESSPPPSPSASPGTPSGATTGVPSYRGSEPGLYGGSRDATSCDVEQQISFLEADRAKALAFAGAQGIDVGAVPSFLRSLTPVQLRKDTRVTNHGFRDGKATAFQSVLQAGTAVLIDSRGLPRVRCACGNPLAEPEPLSSEAKTSGTSWPGYRAANTVAVSPATTEMRSFVLYDAQTNQYFDRPRGTDGGSDTWAPPPGTSTGSPSPTQSPGSETPSTPSTSASSPSTPETTGTTTAPETPTTTTVPPAPSGGESAPSS